MDKRSFYSTPRGFQVYALAIGLLAFALRYLFSSVAIVDNPIRGDAIQYVNYAFNLLHHGTFSLAPPGSVAVVPDAYRAPGYPALIALAFWIAAEKWYVLILLLQAALGAATTILSIHLARRFLAAPASLLVGLLVAFWPHLITIGGYLLSESLYGFFVVLSLLLIARAQERQDRASAIAAGLSAGLAYLVNPVFLLFPVAAAAMMLVSPAVKRSTAFVFLATAMLIPVGWGIRDANIPPPPTGNSRAIETFVIGSWPQWYAAYLLQHVDPGAQQLLDRANGEKALLNAEFPRGARVVLARFGSDPVGYARWYFIDKPFLLWDWDIRIGQGDIYVYPTSHSPVERVPVLSHGRDLLRMLNPAIFFFSAGYALVALWRAVFRPESRASVVVLLALLFCYVTALHAVLQAEPRYSIPYRPVEMILAVGALAALGQWARGKFGRDRAVAAAPERDSA